MREQVKPLIPDEKELIAFAQWAFGKDFQELEIGLDFMKHWNNLHREKLKLRPLGNIAEDISKMVELWKERDI